jgi:hypothetical protein
MKIQTDAYKYIAAIAIVAIMLIICQAYALSLSGRIDEVSERVSNLQSEYLYQHKYKSYYVEKCWEAADLFGGRFEEVARDGNAPHCYIRGGIQLHGYPGHYNFLTEKILQKYPANFLEDLINQRKAELYDKKCEKC